VDPEILVHEDPQELLANADEGGPLRNRVGGEVVQLHPVVVAQSAHEVARRHGEAAFMVLDEADHIAEQRVELPIRRRQNDPRRRLPLHIRR
jgi:hypothetical protein